MNEVSLDKVLLDEELNVMICCEEHICALGISKDAVIKSAHLGCVINVLII